MNNTFNAILVLLAFSVVAVALFRRIRFPSLLAYLFVGILLAVFNIPGLTQQTDQIRHLAEFGVVFLLFTVGLELPLHQLFAMKYTVLGLGGAQVLITTIIAALVSIMMGSTLITALIVGAVIALSSTAIVLRQLNEQLEIRSRHGSNAIGILIFQDLAVIPFLILLPQLGSIVATDVANVAQYQDLFAIPLFNFVPLITGNFPVDAAQLNELLAIPFYNLVQLSGKSSEIYLLSSLSLAFVKGLVAIALMLAIGRWLLRPLFREIASARSTELFMLTVLLVTLTSAWSTHLLVHSPALGAFMAGVMLSETEFRHQIEANIKPFRDILLGLFFITIGMLLDLHVVFEHWQVILLAVFSLIILKTLIIAVLAIIFKHDSGVAFRTGLVLAQGGEFGFAILSLALKDNLIDSNTVQFILSITILSMIIAPLLIRLNGPIVKAIMRQSYIAKRKEYYSKIKDKADQLQGHVVICGYGRVGQNVARFLDIESIPYLALEVDPDVVKEASNAGDSVYFGDSTNAAILKLANLNTARVLVISFEHRDSAHKILEQVRTLNHDIPVLVRTSDDSGFKNLLDNGATEVVPEKLEASLALITHLFLLLDFPREHIATRINRVRSDHYKVMRNFFHETEPGSIEETTEKRQKLHSVTLPDCAKAVGKPLASLNLSEHGVTVVSILRAEGKITNPAGDMVLCDNDVVVLSGQPEDIEHVEGLMLNG